ncbi:MAG TPA: DUF3160 domain-containing protein [Sumerlaeia bacterium]|nr:DUF3160 domain-containing protein [Sumerlaeia bacterium]
MRKRRRPRLVAVALLLASLGAAARGEMLATIVEDVEGEFATYRPVLVNVTPNARQYTIDPDFGNVVNYSQFHFTDTEAARLRENGFVAIPSEFLEMCDVYVDALENEIPVFVTVDAMLHVFHEQFDFILKTLEKEQFQFDLQALTEALLLASDADLGAAQNPVAVEAAKRNLAFFSVARTLIGTAYTPLPAVRELVDAERALIDAHAGPALSPIFAAPHDYTQFIVRGHYEGDPELERFFRAMMWYGSMRFVIEEPFIPEEILRRTILQGLLVTRLLHRTEVATGQSALEVWNRIYQPTVFFVGKAEDADVFVFDRIARAVYGENYRELSPDELAEAAPLGQFVARAKALPAPQIGGAFRKSFRFMGQRYIPDSYITQVTSGGNGGPWRMPKGLDVMAVLHSSRAFELLRDAYDDVPVQLDDLRAEFRAMTPETWAQNVYWNWLYCLMPLLEIKGDGYPPFMQTPAWQDKDLAAALGSWAELRHDTILYAKQSSFNSAPMYQADLGYVEPNPEAFARLAALSLYEKDGLENLGLVLDPFRNNLAALASALLSLKTIAEKELTGQPITFEEYVFIKEIGDTMSDLSPSSSFEEEDDMAVIADVHTDNFIRKVLEEAVGRPLLLYVIVETEGELRITRGAAFSYYEFTMPSSQRLTDSKWREMLDSGQAPDMPAWMQSYLDDGSSPPGEPWHAFAPAGSLTGLTVIHSPSRVAVGGTLEIRLTDILFPSFDEARAIIAAPSGTTFTLILAEDPERPGEYVGAVDTSGWETGRYRITGEIVRDGVVLISSTDWVKVVESDPTSTPGPASTSTPVPTPALTGTPITTPTLTSTPTPEPIRELIESFYRLVLGRDPEPGAVDAWREGYFEYAASFGIDVRFIPREMARLFFLSEEYAARNRTNAEFLTDCYRVFLNRDPNDGELADWLGGVWNRSEVMTIFSESEEFARRIEAMVPGMQGDPARNFVTAMYVGLLDRLVDSGGLAYFSILLELAGNKRDLAKWMAAAIVISQEFLSKEPTNQERVIRLFRAFLGRFPNDRETDYWTGQLDGGLETIDDLVDRFADSEEFAARLAGFFGS